MSLHICILCIQHLNKPREIVIDLIFFFLFFDLKLAFKTSLDSRKKVDGSHGGRIVSIDSIKCGP